MQRRHTKALVDKISIDWRKNVTNTFVEVLQSDTSVEGKHNFYANVLETHLSTGLHRLFRAGEMIMSSLVSHPICGSARSRLSVCPARPALDACGAGPGPGGHCTPAPYVVRHPHPGCPGR